MQHDDGDEVAPADGSDPQFGATRLGTAPDDDAAFDHDPAYDENAAYDDDGLDDEGGDADLPSPAASADGEGQRSVRIPHANESVPAIRRILHEDLTARGVTTEIVEEAETVASELVANAVKHAKPLGDGCVRIRWKVKSGTVEVEVSDGGSPATPRPVPPSPWANSGRGLRIVRSLAHEWGVQDDRNGRTVWAALGGPSRRRRL